jgi:hypothetical protein
VFDIRISCEPSDLVDGFRPQDHPLDEEAFSSGIAVPWI